MMSERTTTAGKMAEVVPERRELWMGAAVVALMVRGRRFEQPAWPGKQLEFRWPDLLEGPEGEAAQMISVEVASGQSHLAEGEERMVVRVRMTVEVEEVPEVPQEQRTFESLPEEEEEVVVVRVWLNPELEGELVVEAPLAQILQTL